MKQFHCEECQAAFRLERDFVNHVAGEHGRDKADARKYARKIGKRDSRHYRYIGEYLTACRGAFKAASEGRLIRLWWGGNGLNLDQWRREFIGALNRRINSKVSEPPAWRKLDGHYQTCLWRDARRVEKANRRVRVYQFETAEARSRFSHLLATRDD